MFVKNILVKNLKISITNTVQQRIHRFEQKKRYSSSSGGSSVTQDGGKNSSTICHIIPRSIKKNILNICEL